MKYQIYFFNDSNLHFGRLPFIWVLFNNNRALTFTVASDS